MIHVGHVRLFCTSLGPADGPALLLVHGWGGDGREWSPHAEVLAERFRVIVPDLRGHGRSEAPGEGNTPAEMAHDLAALTDALGTGPVVAVGHSMGGQVVNLLAVHHPHTVRSVIALEPAHGAHGEEVAGIPARLDEYRTQGSRAAAAFVAGAFSDKAPAGCAPRTCAPSSARRAMSSRRRTRARTPTRAPSGYARTARRTCAGAPRQRSRCGPRPRPPHGSVRRSARLVPGSTTGPASATTCTRSSPSARSG
ncbi:alpha/beta hydrolase [Streptomyces diastatochromogenes]|nr:alpha/beta hydrolase [Streptomyces diastatochromogenes]